MRVIAGSARGRRLKPIPGRSVRPTSDRVREALFSLVGPGPAPSPVLDLFAGTGALGIEALSRGAEQGVFVEADRRVAAVVRHNLDSCGFAPQARIEIRDAERFLDHLDRLAPFALVLLDPPYKKGFIERCLQALGQPGWLAEQGRVFCEAEAGLELAPGYGLLSAGRHKRYGDTALWEFIAHRSGSGDG